MNDSTAVWANGLLFATLCAFLGIVGFVSARSREARRLTGGLFLQGVLVMFVVAARYFKGAKELQLAALVIGGFLIIHSLSARPDMTSEPKKAKDHSA